MPESMRPTTTSAMDDSRPWLKIYPAQCGPELTPDFSDVLSAFRHSVTRHPNALALIYFDDGLSYADLDRRSDAVAGWLASSGVRRGDRVAIVMQNVPDFPIACLAAWKLGAIPVPGNPMYRASEMARIFTDAEPSALLCQATEIDELTAALALSKLSHIPICFTNPRQIDADHGRGEPVSLRRAKPIEAVFEDFSDWVSPDLRVADDDIGLILYTSGTTGEPKGAMLKHRSLAFNGQFIREWCELSKEDRILCIAPFFHITGLVCHICAAFSAGCALIANYRFDPATVLQMIKNHRPTFTIGAITAFNALARFPGAKAEDMVSLRKVFSGGAPIPPALCEMIKAKLGLTIYPTYGMTELSSATVFSPMGRQVPQRDDVLSIGLPIPSTDVKIVDEMGAEVALGETGEIVVAGPQVMAGYWRKPEITESALVDGWMQTGDVGFMDDEGWMYLVDRKKDVIIASGFKVWPREVEDALYAHPAVREAAVIGIADPYRGESVKACVSLLPGTSATSDELIGHCRERLAAYKIPRLVDIMADLPKTASGKIQRVELRNKS